MYVFSEIPEYVWIFREHIEVLIESRFFKENGIDMEEYSGSFEEFLKIFFMLSVYDRIVCLHSNKSLGREIAEK